MVMGSASLGQLLLESVMLSEAPGPATASPLSLRLRAVPKHAALPAETWPCCLGKGLPGDLPPTSQEGLGTTFLGCLAGLSEHPFALRVPNSNQVFVPQGTAEEKVLFEH